MKRSHLAIAILFSMSILMTSAVAQTAAVKTKIPFDFTVARQTFPAGEYTISERGTMLQLVSLDNHGSAYVQKYIAAYKNKATPKVVFHRYGKRNFLSQVWTTDTVHELFASSREIEYARTDKQEQVVVLASVLHQN